MSELAKYTPEVFEKTKEKMLSLLDKDIVAREISFAIQAINNNSYLAGADRTSIQMAVYNIATTGLSLNPVLKFAALVPRYDSKKKCLVAVLEPMYQGLVKLLTDTGSVKTCYAYNVYADDEFEVEFGTQPRILHKPTFKTKTITHTYAVGILPDGTMQFEVMPKSDIDEIRARSDSYKAYKDGKTKTCIWVTDEGEMCKKTVIKRLFKYLPKSEQYDKVAEAVELLNSDYKISHGQEDYLLSLLAKSVYAKDEDGEMLQRKIEDGLTFEEFKTMERDLLNNQLDPVTSGMNYNQGDIKQHLKKLN